jgi:hypothetical protein
VLLVHVAGDPPDRPTLARGVATLEEHDHPAVLVLQVALQLEQLHLVGLELFFLADTPGYGHGAHSYNRAAARDPDAGIGA